MLPTLGILTSAKSFQKTFQNPLKTGTISFINGWKRLLQWRLQSWPELCKYLLNVAISNFTNHTVVTVNNEDTDVTFTLSSNNDDSIVSVEKISSFVTSSLIIDFGHVFPYLVA